MPSLRRHLTLDVLRHHVEERLFAPSDRGLVGVEIELLTYPAADPLDRPAVADLTALAERTVLPAGGRITIEPGGQVELSSRPYRGLARALPAVAADLEALEAALRHSGLEPVARGLDTLRRPQRVLDRPRYRAMEAFFDTEGFAGRTMMCSTASLQVNLEIGAAADVAARWSLAHALGPVLVASFAHSPVPGGGGVGPRSARQQVWSVTDSTRTGPVHVPGADAGRTPSDQWLDYALAARVMMIRVTPDRFVAGGRPLGREALTFAAWMQRGHELGWPTVEDFEYHLTTLFPPVRPRGWLELRMIDSLPDPWWAVAAAVASAALDDPAAAAECSAALAGPVGSAWTAAARSGLSDPALQRAAGRVFGAALDALPRLGADRATIAATEAFVDRFVARGRCPADEPVSLPEVELAVA